ncbi:PhzF family phenazine biosynthesis protein [Actinoplanes bogorensis]|uniref:PhzF family phenazine biosynthesis protein n=1 Tax=Paractinoplanes bogorensis TaxID=1610840 RepID=A0ABS5YHT8_9ACTN|nr:PhzF family phenazine biosynthesis protein [Actinoplanes bogorensis]MBU2663027.1 PhzF family phenazine biosynthesis protein [Actinoplanes bogorensis]
MSGVAYEIVDVFTDRPFAGNPLAVVYGAEDLATDQMHTLAREFNLAETVFVLPPTDSSATYRARIFTPEGEIPFAGHPSVGAAVTSMRRDLFPPSEVVQECGAGLLPITVRASGSATLTSGTPQLGPPLDPAPLLGVVGLTQDDFAGLPPRLAGGGLDWIFLPVRRDALARIEVDTAAARRAGVTDLSVFSWSPETSEAHARVFIPGTAVPEDPATGSAALGLGLWLVAAGLLPPDGTSSYRVHQGIEMKRPSLLDCTVTAVDGVATLATVTGHVVPIARGEITVPPFIG